jgi:EAL domain-containing protein (putative c-di-GMP-specific phosphodiesterase class I)
MEPNIIKLDASLIRHIDSDTRLGALAKSLITFASEIGATTVGEGVETRTELEALASLAAINAQGYLLGRPMNAETAFGPPEAWSRG